MAVTLASTALVTGLAVAPASAKVDATAEQLVQEAAASVDESPQNIAEGSQSEVVGDISLTSLDRGNKSLNASSAESVQLFTVLDDRSAQHKFRFRVNLPEGATIQEVEDPEIFALILSDDNVIGEIQQPWAVDNAGNQVATTFSLKGDVLTQRVDKVESTAYPLVADPRITLGWIWPYGTVIYARYSKGDVVYLSRIGASSAAKIVGSAICQRIPLPTGRRVCTKLVLDRARLLASVFDDARRRGRCVTVVTGYNPISVLYFRAYTYSC